MSVCVCRTSSVMFIEITGLQKRIKLKSYIYAVLVKRSDGASYEVGKSFNDFVKLDELVHSVLKKKESATLTGSTVVKQLKNSGRSLFRSGFQKAQSRISVIVDYCNTLVNAKDEQVIDLVRAFFREERCQQENCICQLVEISRVLTEMEESNISAPVYLPLYQVTIAFTSADKQKISLQKDQCVKIIKKCSSGWWLVCSDDMRTGWFPVAYLKNISEDDDDVITSKSSGQMAQYYAIKDYTAAREDEISFQKGNVLDVLEKKLDGWWIVQLDHVIGFAPAVYLELQCLSSELDQGRTMSSRPSPSASQTISVAYLRGSVDAVTISSERFSGRSTLRPTSEAPVINRSYSFGPSIVNFLLKGSTSLLEKSPIKSVEVVEGLSNGPANFSALNYSMTF